MIKYFYLVEYNYLVNKDEESGFNLGIFSTKKKALEKIELSKNLPGFNKYGIENFSITKFGVNFDYDLKNKSNVSLFQIALEWNEDEEDISYYVIFGYYSNLKEANLEMKKLKKHSRIGKKHPNNFEINEMKVDNFNSWSEGFKGIDE